jgi:hypothetical protein
MAAALELPFLDSLPAVAFTAALIAWTLACAGLLWEIRKFVRSRRSSPATTR